MGLDIYVGPLTRYYLGDWETIVQQISREQGFEVSIVRPALPRQSWFHRLVDRFRLRGSEAAVKRVHRWRQRMRKELHLPNLDWNEDPEAEYDTDKPAWDGYGALVLWAAYEELRFTTHRETAEGWEEDRAYLTIRNDPQSRFRHLVADTEIWLPVEFDPPRRTQSIVGEPVTVGSSVRLLADLRELNSRTWAASDQQIAQWRHEGAEYGSPLEISARFSFSIFYELARRSVSARLPMKLDY